METMHRIYGISTEEKDVLGFQNLLILIPQQQIQAEGQNNILSKYIFQNPLLIIINRSHYNQQIHTSRTQRGASQQDSFSWTLYFCMAQLHQTFSFLHQNLYLYQMSEFTTVYLFYYVTFVKYCKLLSK